MPADDRGRRPGPPPEPLIHVGAAAPGAAPETCVRTDALNDVEDCLRALRGDPSVRSTEAGRDLLRLLAGTRRAVQALGHLADFLPPHRIETVASLARSLAVAWSRLAEELDDQQGPGRAVDQRERTTKVS